MAKLSCMTPPYSMIKLHNSTSLKGKEPMSTTRVINARPFSIRDKIGYMFGDFGNDFTFIFASAFLMIFYTKVMGISGVIVGTLFLVARIIDAIADVTVGVLVDKASTHEGGKYRVIMMRMAAPVAIFSFLMYQGFFAQSAMWVRITYMTITYLAWGILYSCVYIPYGAMAAVISPNPKDRTSLSTFRAIGAAFAGMIVGIVTPIIVYTKDAQGNQIIRGGEHSNIFMWVALLYSILAFCCYVLCYVNTVERVRIEPDTHQHATDNQLTDNQPTRHRTIWQMIIEACSSSAMLGLMGSAVALLVSYLFLQQMVMYIYTDYFRSAKMLSMNYAIEGTVMLCITAPWATFAAKRIGHRAVAIFGSALGTMSILVLFLLHTTNGWLFLTIYNIAGIGISTFIFVAWAMVTDVIDDNEVRHGIREDATYNSVYSFARKVGQALGGWFAGLCLTLVGYQKGAQAVQSQATLDGLYNAITVLPMIFLAIMFIMLVFVYPLSKARVDANTAHLEQLRSA